MSAARLGATALFVASLLAMGSLHQEHTTWNVNSRMALVFAIVERHTFAIDGYVGDNDVLPTMDKAVFGGHTYSDKVFGVSLIGVPVYAAMQAIARITGHEWPLRWKIYFLRMACASIPAAMSLVLLWRLLILAGGRPDRALFGTAFAFFGSLWFGYSTIAMPYSAGIAACLAATWLLVRRTPDEISLADAAGVGLLCGFAVICDFIFGLMVAPIALLFLIATWRPRAAGRLSKTIAAGTAAAIPIGAFVMYTLTIFGKVTIPYEFEAVTLFRDEMARGIMGVTMPHLGPLWFLTFHPFRGVFFWSSWILIALVGAAAGIRRGGLARMLGWMSLWAFAAALLFNSGYYMWWGGWSMGARLTLPMMAAVPLGLVEACRSDARRLWQGLVATGLASALLSVPLSLIDPQLRQGYDDAALMTATAGTRLMPPQFHFLRVYYFGEWFIGSGGVVHAGHFVPPVATLAAALLLVAAGARLRRMA